MKKFMVSLLSLVVMATMCVPALAVEGTPVEGDPCEGIEISESTHSPMTRSTFHEIHSRTLTGLNAGYSYERQQDSFRGYEVPSKTLYYTTDLTSTGSKNSVKMGLGRYDPTNDIWGSYSLVNMTLRDNTYAWPTMEDNRIYYPYLYNSSKGVVRGTVAWYSMTTMD
jgi:hypothetical protein